MKQGQVSLSSLQGVQLNHILCSCTPFTLKTSSQSLGNEETGAWQNVQSLARLPTGATAEPTLSSMLCCCQQVALKPTNKICFHLPLVQGTTTHIMSHYVSSNTRVLCCKSLKFATDPIYLSVYSRRQRTSTLVLVSYMPSIMQQPLTAEHIFFCSHRTVVKSYPLHRMETP